MEYIQRKADQNSSATALLPLFWCMYSINLLNQIAFRLFYYVQPLLPFEGKRKPSSVLKAI